MSHMKHFDIVLNKLNDLSERFIECTEQGLRPELTHEEGLAVLYAAKFMQEHKPS